MPLQKQEFYEGAALHRLLRGVPNATVSYEAPFFVFNGRLQIHVKYSTGKSSPWSFTFARDEQQLIHARAQPMPLVIGLVCGAEGIVTLPFEAFESVAGLRDTALHVACYRRHGTHFEVCGPDGTCADKVPASDWRRLLNDYPGEPAGRET